MALIEANEKKPELERLERGDFTLDLDEQVCR
jgi:hypothetical protein